METDETEHIRALEFRRISRAIQSVSNTEINVRNLMRLSTILVLTMTQKLIFWSTYKFTLSAIFRAWLFTWQTPTGKKKYNFFPYSWQQFQVKRSSGFCLLLIQNFYQHWNWKSSVRFWDTQKLWTMYEIWEWSCWKSMSSK